MEYTCERIPYLRDVRTNEYLPQVVRDAKEMIDIHAVNDKELEAFWKILNDIYYNRFICSADEVGLSRYENLLGIAANGTLEERRRRVHYEWNKQIVYTDRSVRQMMTDLLGTNGFFMTIIYDEYLVRFEVNAAAGRKTNRRFVEDELRRIVPANMGIQMGIYWESALIYETSYQKWKYRYILCGERNCGVIPWYGTRGVIYEIGLTIGIRDQVMCQLVRHAADDYILNRQHINPRTEVDTEIILDDLTPWQNENGEYPIIESGQY